MAVTSTRESIFIAQGGTNLFLLFCLVSSLFLLWGFCNGMIDIMDKHFQNELHLSLAQSAWVQFAHYLGYLLMALPAGGLAVRLGYKGGIIAGLLIVAVGGLWFLPATHIAKFWAFLLGVCVIASGLTFLETVANPYVAILGHPRYSAVRINLAQSCNGIGWILGPIAGGAYSSTRKMGRGGTRATRRCTSRMSVSPPLS
jgi:FHS family L-fucose permease-like MFS transporter